MLLEEAKNELCEMKCGTACEFTAEKVLRLTQICLFLEDEFKTSLAVNNSLSKIFCSILRSFSLINEFIIARLKRNVWVGVTMRKMCW